jgi:hypothetical protein
MALHQAACIDGLRKIIYESSKIKEVVEEDVSD